MRALYPILKIRSGNSPQDSDEIHDKKSVTITYVLAEIQM